MDNIRAMSAGVQKTMLKSIITSLLDHSKPLYKYGTLTDLSLLISLYINLVFSYLTINHLTSFMPVPV